MIKPKQAYFSIFQVDGPTLDRLIAESLSRGGDYADLYFENTTYGNLTLRDGEVTSGGEHIDFGVGIRVLDGEKTGYAYSESTAVPDMLSAARAAAAIADGAGARPCDRPTRRPVRGEPNPAADRYPVRRHWRSTPAADLLPFLQRLEKSIRSRDSRIVKVIAMLSFQVSDILMYNAFGELKYDTRPMGSVSASVIFQQGGQTENKTCWRRSRPRRLQASTNGSPPGGPRAGRCPW